ncbi:MAG TPA: hypothetical protein VFA10_22750, partial [Ktedonobacteraceae bacterium]|nr:hypothetical protein [Ktedonobacteraceae bacterium]
MSQRSTPRPWPTRLLLLALLLGASGIAWAATRTPPVAHAAAAISPYVWGTNLTLSDQNDLFLTNAATLKLTQQLHVQMIRFPDRGNLAVTTAAAKQIQALHLVPLLILHYGTAQVSADKALIQMMNSVFGNQTVYYEYGNEMDLQGVDATAYTASWNTVISQFQSLSPTGKFIGPANYQANPSYVGYFVQHANPQPFGVSWHEYTCNSQQTDQYCLSHIDNWTTHIQATRQAMGKSLPILITEYNWNP